MKYRALQATELCKESNFMERLSGRSDMLDFKHICTHLQLCATRIDNIARDRATNNCSACEFLHATAILLTVTTKHKPRIAMKVSLLEQLNMRT